MATIKAIEARSVHQIQSGQVIVDLCSVTKELVENSLDAGATSIEVRLKNNGLDLIEVQDNGSGISSENYDYVALKHYTSKLSSYDDLARLRTFGFRGEALSSLCALSSLHIVTALADQAPKANRLDFEISGRLKSVEIVAGQKGTTTSVEGLFKRLPVRRRELEKNIRREYGKVLSLLQAYACISTGVRFSVRNTVGKTRNVVIFTTNGSQTTKDNIANVYGAKTLSALTPLDLTLEFEPSAATRQAAIDAGQEVVSRVLVKGHISRPIFGEGRQAPDRQMFFVNSRPCALPHITKAVNEVYRSFNVSQSPFIFADFHMDTEAYDVNVSPDKRTILLHDSAPLVEALKASLIELFDTSDQTVPQSQVLTKAMATKQHRQIQLSDVLMPRGPCQHSQREAVEGEDSTDKNVRSDKVSPQAEAKSLSSDESHPGEILSSVGNMRFERQELSPASSVNIRVGSTGGDLQVIDVQDVTERTMVRSFGETSPHGMIQRGQPSFEHELPKHRPASAGRATPAFHNPPEESSRGIQDVIRRSRPLRRPTEVATITFNDRTVTSVVGGGISRKRGSDQINSDGREPEHKRHTRASFGKYMEDFLAPNSQTEEYTTVSDREENEEELKDQHEYSDEGSPLRSPSSDESGYTGHEKEEDPTGVDDGASEKSGVSRPVVQVEDEIDEVESRAREEARVNQLIRQAEGVAVLQQKSSSHRMKQMSRGVSHRDSTVNLVSTVNGSLLGIQSQVEKLQKSLKRCAAKVSGDGSPHTTLLQESEDHLSLSVSKDDFTKMRIVGQFNLGFIITTRSDDSSSGLLPKDELFIIDQHASDEKFNFERLQMETVVQSQRLVQSKTLDLTAVEEEIILENQVALEKNGFVVEMNDSGNEAIGRRCKLVSLPLSKEVVFGVRDLEELIVLLSESPTTEIPRPSKVRKMFAMRACRSSIMIGKALTVRQMERVVRGMGTIDKPWNCPHGRPTMRHLMSLGQWNEWSEFSQSEENEGELDAWKTYYTKSIGPQ